MMPRARRVLLASAAMLGSLALGAGCGGGGGASNDDRFDVMLDFYVNPDHVGIYEAQASGAFDDAGLDVSMRVPSDPAAPIKQVAAGQVDLAISYEPEVMLARDEGLDVVAVGALVHGPLTSLISLPAAGIDEPADLAGTTVVDAGIPYQSAYLQTILGNAGVDQDSVKEVNVGFNLLPPLLSGRADAMLGGFLNVEGVQLERRGDDPRVVPVDRLGIPTYDELVLVADAERVHDDPGQIEDFLSALESGTDAAEADPAGATDALIEAGDGLEPDLTRAEVTETLPLLQARDGDPFGYMDPVEWSTFAEYLHDEGQLDEVPRTGDLLTNDLLPDPR